MANNLLVFKEFSSDTCNCSLFFFIAEKPLNSSMHTLCSGFSEFCHLDHATLEAWLRRIMLGVEDDKGNTGKMADNRLLLQTFATHIVKEARYGTQQ